MIRQGSRLAAVLLVLTVVVHAWPDGKLMFYALLRCVVPALLVCFPEWVDELTYGTSRAGYVIDSHTPAWLVAGIGWFILLLFASLQLYPDWLSRAFGM